MRLRVMARSGQQQHSHCSTVLLPYTSVVRGARSCGTWKAIVVAGPPDRQPQQLRT